MMNAGAIAVIVICLFAVVGGITAGYALLLIASAARVRAESPDGSDADWGQLTASRSRPPRRADLLLRTRSRATVTRGGSEADAGMPGPVRAGDDAGRIRP
jgi:hypothetical protein